VIATLRRLAARRVLAMPILPSSLLALLLAPSVTVEPPVESLPAVTPVASSGVTGELLMHAEVPSSVPQVRPRNVVVWLPPGYSDPAAVSTRHPVLYMHDGQNCFDPSTAFLGREWRADEVADRLVREGRIEPPIIVGIWNTPDRVADYTIDEDLEKDRSDRKPQGRGGRGDAYLRWIVEELKPAIDRRYRTRPDRASTAMMGSSLGGLISLAAAERHPEVFGRIAAVSPSLWWNEGSVIERWRRSTPPVDRLWICMGDQERKGLDESLRRLESAIREGGSPTAERLHAEVVAGGTHDEPSWSARLDRILIHLFPAPLPPEGSSSPPNARPGGATGETSSPAR